MSESKPLKSAAKWVRLSTTEQDWKQADPTLLGTLLTQMHVIRVFEETVLDLAAEGLVHGPAHSSIGQEGGAAGSIVGMTARDQVNGSHRGHHQFLAKCMSYLAGKGLDPNQPLPSSIQEMLRKTLAEILGLAPGFCKGRGGSMHLQWLEAGALGTNAIVGGGVPLAAGSAWANKHSDSGGIAVTYFGDGAVNIGSVLETMNLASAWKLPLCFFIENNGYAVSTTVDEANGEPRLGARGQAFNIPSWSVDGMDPLAVHLAMKQASEHMRAGKGPTIIEAEVYRFFHQNGPFPGSAFGYRTKEEEAAWRKRDPLDLLARNMQSRKLITAKQVGALRSRIQAVMLEAVESLIEHDPTGKPGKRRIRPDQWPAPDFCDVGIRGDLSEFQGAPQVDESVLVHEGQSRKFIDVVADVMHRRMETDPTIVVMGEDVHRLKGGTNGATRGLKERFPDRVLGTPISECAFAGLGGGLAMDRRYRPVVEFMYPDFMWVAGDQVFNQIGKARHMFGGDNPVPFVLRTKVAMGTGYGSQHSMDPAGIFATCPGWRIVAPSNPIDYVGLMNAALRCQDPVLVIEHVDLYNSTAIAPTGDFDYVLPPGRAALRSEGKDMTIISYLSMVNHSLEAIELTSASADLIDLRWLDRASIDWDTIGESIRKTNAVMIVEQGARGTSYGGWLADEIQRRYFDWLDMPVHRVTGAEAAPSISKVLERAACARTEEVVTAIERVLSDKGMR